MKLHPGPTGLEVPLGCEVWRRCSRSLWLAQQGQGACLASSALIFRRNVSLIYSRGSTVICWMNQSVQSLFEKINTVNIGSLFVVKCCFIITAWKSAQQSVNGMCLLEHSLALKCALCVFNSFTEIWFICHKVYPFEIYYSVFFFFLVYLQSCAIITIILILEHFISRNPVPISIYFQS